jgi:sigma-E factor negative regulatory protein RseC
MATEEGIVTRADGALAEVKTVKTEACASCSAKGFCHDSGREMTVSVLNSVNARPGDRVRLEIATGAFVKVMFLLYIVPVLALLAGALIGLAVGGDEAAAVGALIGFVLAVALVRSKGRKMGAMAAYQPRIVRVIQRGPRSGDSKPSVGS